MNLEFGVCNLPMAPLRTEPSHRSEMCSQLLFGDHFSVLENAGAFTRIRTAYDDYEGFIDTKQFALIDYPAFVQLHELNSIVGLFPFFTLTKTVNDEKMFVTAGTNIPSTIDSKFYLGDTRFQVADELVRPDRAGLRNNVRQTAAFYLNTPYLWGGRSVFGIDCSGLTQMVLRQFGIRLKRDAYLQAEQGELVGFLQEAVAGDLAFFDNEEGRIIHVGIMLDSETIIHASGRVRFDPIDNQGIFDRDSGKYTHKLRIIKRY